MIDRITGYTSGVIAPTAGRRSRQVAGEALNQRVLPRREERRDRNSASDQDSNHNRRQSDADESVVEVRLSGGAGSTSTYPQARSRSPYAANPYANATAPSSSSSSDDVLISRSTAVLLTEDLSSLIRRAVTNVGLLVHGLMQVPDSASHDVERRFHIAALSAVRLGRERYLRKAGSANSNPRGLAFENISVRYDGLRGTATIEIGAADFLDRIDMRATGVVFDVRGNAAVHDARPGIFVDTGAHGAAIANRIIETVRRDLPLFGGSDDTEGAIVLIRADNSDFSDHRAPAEWLRFDLILPFRKP
ncbi:hypothetical protein [Nisaea denitrificans]|uniref:hypothetical protein n=1 Tax=Nisaea denitrificans TaxID=390877 RepID=UPI00042256AB|nr:hypothetical protein [Nisaea denitrificans]